MLLKKTKNFKKNGIIFIVTLVIVLIIRSFLVQPYTVSSSQMETALLKGDRVFVNKTSYGIRLPITLLSIPFLFDKVLGIKSYTDLIELPYYRIFEKMIEQNDIVLFNNPLDTDKPLDKRNLVLSRCIGIAGDSIKVKDGNLYINEQKYVYSPDRLLPFRYKKALEDTISSVMLSYNIPIRKSKEDSAWAYTSFNKHEAFLINQKLAIQEQLEPIIEPGANYNIMIPKKGLEVTLTPFNVHLFKSIIEDEIGKNNSVTVSNSQIIKNGTPLDKYQFENNYYWFMSDNAESGTDSRHLGFISEKYIIGKVSLVWFNFSNNTFDWSRTFKSIN